METNRAAWARALHQASMQNATLDTGAHRTSKRAHPPCLWPGASHLRHMMETGRVVAS